MSDTVPPVLPPNATSPPPRIDGVPPIAPTSHRLPEGMRDWLPRQARQRASVAQRILSSVELCAYQRVALPAFEYVDTPSRGIGNGDAALRFVEPSTGKVAMIRSDVTPQIARLVASRYSDGPWPARFAYKATVMRRRRERARLDQQLLQVGLELVGSPAERGDLEVLECATRALRSAGVERFTVDLAHAQVSSSLVDLLPPEAQSDALECLALKDARELERVALRGALSKQARQALVALPTLHGGGELWSRANGVLAGTPAEAPLASLHRVWQAAVAADLAPHFVVDLGETREFYYYTGVMFHLLAEGPGEPLGSGGRYDALLERFQLPCPAAGFAFDVANVCWALDVCGGTEPPRQKLLVSVEPAQPGLANRAPQLLRELRSLGVACAEGPEPAEADAYCLRWDFTHRLRLGTETAALERVESGVEQALEHDSAEQLAKIVASELGLLDDIAQRWR